MRWIAPLNVIRQSTNVVTWHYHERARETTEPKPIVGKDTAGKRITMETILTAGKIGMGFEDKRVFLNTAYGWQSENSGYDEELRLAIIESAGLDQLEHKGEEKD